MNKLTSKFILIAVSFCFVFAACVHEPVPPRTDDPPGVSFNDEILPLLTSSCAKVGCHTGMTPPKNVNLSTYPQVIETGDVEAGNPDDSKLYKVMIEDSPSKVMPPNTPLPKSQIELMKTWIEEGAKDN